MSKLQGRVIDLALAFHSKGLAIEPEDLLLRRIPLSTAQALVVKGVLKKDFDGSYTLVNDSDNKKEK